MTSDERDVGFWTREFGLYLAEHRHPGNRATHFIGIPLLLVTAVWGIVTLDLVVFVIGQLAGWALQLAGHAIEGNRPALLKRPIAFVMGPLMVLVELAGVVGVRPAFVRRARRLERP